MNEIYRCGYCGQPTDSSGSSLSIDESRHITDNELENATLVHGMCCAMEWCDDIEKRIIIVTRDMAIDAGDLSLEGEEWIW